MFSIHVRRPKGKSGWIILNTKRSVAIVKVGGKNVGVRVLAGTHVCKETIDVDFDFRSTGDKSKDSFCVSIIEGEKPEFTIRIPVADSKEQYTSLSFPIEFLQHIEQHWNEIVMMLNLSDEKHL